MLFTSEALGAGAGEGVAAAAAAVTAAGAGEGVEGAAHAGVAAAAAAANAAGAGTAAVAAAGARESVAASGSAGAGAGAATVSAPDNVVHDFSYADKPTPIYVMLPLDVVTRDGKLQHVKALDVSLKTLKKIGVEGVMLAGAYTRSLFSST